VTQRRLGPEVHELGVEGIGTARSHALRVRTAGLGDGRAGAHAPYAAGSMSRSLPLTVLAWKGPQPRAYLVRMRRAGLRPDRVMLIVRDPAAEKRGRPAARPSRRAERGQDRSHNFHPYAIRKRSPELVAAIGDAMRALVEDPIEFYAEMYD